MFVTTMDGSLVIMEGSMLSVFFVAALGGSLVIVEGSMLSRCLLLQRMVAF